MFGIVRGEKIILNFFVLGYLVLFIDLIQVVINKFRKFRRVYFNYLFEYGQFVEVCGSLLKFLILIEEMRQLSCLYLFSVNNRVCFL